VNEPCLICGGPAEPHHFPHTRRYGDATVPLCRPCHIAAHWAKPAVIARLIARAPAYWQSIGEWDMHRDSFETWLARREYREAVSV
jgi:hypothetical protein